MDGLIRAAMYGAGLALVGAALWATDGGWPLAAGAVGGILLFTVIFGRD